MIFITTIVIFITPLVIFITHVKGLQDGMDEPFGHKGIVTGAHTFLDTSLVTLSTIATDGCEVSRGEFLLAHLLVSSPLIASVEVVLVDHHGGIWLDYGMPCITGYDVIHDVFASHWKIALPLVTLFIIC